MTLSKVIKISVYAFILTSCGAAEQLKDQSENTSATGGEVTPEAATTTEVVTDKSLSSEDISTQTSSALETISGMGSSQTAALSLNGGASNDIDEERVCTAKEDGSVEVSITRSKERQQTKTLNNLSKEISSAKNSSIIRTWSKEGETLACNSEGTRIERSPENLSGMVKKSEFSKEMSQAITMTKNGTTTEFNRKRTHKGTRTTTFSDASLADSLVTVTKTISIESQITGDRLNKNGESKSMSISLKTQDAAPLVIEEVKDATSREWKSRKIVSGTTIGTHQDGGRLEVTYENALFTREAECTPVSGTIKGSFFKSGEETASRTFTIDLSSESKTISFDNNETIESDFTGCGFSKPIRKTVRKVMKNKQKKFNRLERRKNSAAQNKAG